MKKVLSVILCLAMVLSLLPLAAFAAPENPFKDVKESDYFYDAVLWAVEEDITTGTSATTFSPNANCTRAQVVTFLWRSAGCPEPAPMDNPFKDVDPSAYYYKAVLWAVGSKITTGTSATTFSPDASCTRAQVVTFMWRAAGQQEVSSSNPFKDVKESEYYYKAVLWAVDRGITTGLSATSFGPNATCTRAQIVTFLYRFIGAPDPLTIIFQPADYYMDSSMETADFVVHVAGGAAPYTFQWVICYDNEEVRPDPVTSESPIHVLSRSFSDYDFDDYRKIAVYCIITDAEGDRVETQLAEVLPYTGFKVTEAPADYYMTSAKEFASFTVKVTGGVPGYAYGWHVVYDDEDTFTGTMTGEETENTFTWGFTADDFAEFEEIAVYCVITDSTGRQIETDWAHVHPYAPLTLTESPVDYHMTSSQEDATFTVEVDGGKPAYTYEWVVVRDGAEECVETEVTDNPFSTLVYEFTDYDFDDYKEISVYCIVTDEDNNVVVSDEAMVIPKG